MYENAWCCARMTRTRANDVQSPEDRDDALLKPSLAAQLHAADAALAGAEPTQKRMPAGQGLIAGGGAKTVSVAVQPPPPDCACRMA
jgi:hypothetical protein